MVRGTFPPNLGSAWVYLCKFSHPACILLGCWLQPGSGPSTVHTKGCCSSGSDCRGWYCHPLSSGAMRRAEAQAEHQQLLGPCAGIKTMKSSSGQGHAELLHCWVSTQTGHSPGKDRNHIYWATGEKKKKKWGVGGQGV